MSRTILAEVDGFTPVIDSVIDATESLITSVVFGRIWRYCQMKDGVCNASLDKIADGIGLSRNAVQEHAKILCDAGYLQDMTPDLRNHPHTYRDTGKAGLHLGVSAKASVIQDDVKKAGVIHDDATVIQDEASVILVDEKIDSKKELKKQEQETHTHSFSPVETAKLKNEYMESNTTTYRKAHVMLMNVSSLPAIPRDQEGYIDTVQAMIGRYGEEATKEALQRACLKWITTQGKNGRNYSKTNFKWVDWAMDGISGGGKAVDPAMKTHNELMAMIRGEA